ncbi:MAG: acyl-CoA dehydrogenase N-terminal domain-containing protein, partial [Pseudomonadota bacterium]
MPYDAPIDDMLFTLEAVADYGEIAAMPGNEEFDASVAEAVLEEAARLARESLTPLNTVGDQQGAVLKDGKVVTPPGWHEAHQLLAEGGWVGLAKSPEFGGQG